MDGTTGSLLVGGVYGVITVVRSGDGCPATQ